MLALLDATVAEVDLEEWTTALAKAMCDQISLYNGNDQVIFIITYFVTMC